MSEIQMGYLAKFSEKTISILDDGFPFPSYTDSKYILCSGEYLANMILNDAFIVFESFYLNIPEYQINHSGEELEVLGF